MKSYTELKQISDEFFQLAHSLVAKHPYAVCMAMHEYARNLYPSDPYISFAEENPTERLYSVTQNCLQFLNASAKMGSYEADINDEDNYTDVKDDTGNVYGQLWAKFSYEQLIEKAHDILKERLTVNDIDTSYFAGKKALDIGCGSGRFTFALKKLGCSPVQGVDYGDQGLGIANDLVQKSQEKDISFSKVNVLDLPFEDETFDFVFCNGVLHHTENMEKGIEEMIRVAKKGAKLWLYLYADNGIFWYARKEMPKIMKQIPQRYTMKVLDVIGMPQDRFIFCDNWYVPIERHTTDEEARKILNGFGVTNIKRLSKGRSTDLEYHAIHSGEEGKAMYGDGELRYWLEK